MRLGDIITKTVEIITSPLEAVKEAVEGLKEGISGIGDSIRKTMEDMFVKGVEFFFPSFLERLKQEVALKTIDESIFQTEEVKEAVRKLKEKWSKSPSSASQLANDIANIIKGMGSKIQLEAISNIKIDEKTPISLNLFKQIAIITDYCLLSSIISVIGELLSIGQIDNLGRTIREYIEYSGLGQIVGYGYGMLLSSVLSPLITREIDALTTPQLPTVSEALRMYYKGILKEEDFKAVMRKLGFSETMIDLLKQDYLYYPSPIDFIRFAVREVFTEDKETLEALSAEFPTEIVDYARKAGMDEDVLKWYWMAHWELPSPTQVYEMLHRLNPDVLAVRGEAYKQMGLDVDKLKTDLDTVRLYLKQADYDLRWRERLMAISYSPLTRVDLRRIYELGLINEEELLARLMEIGYTKKDAELLLEFYKQYRQDEGREFTKSEIKNLFYYGLLNEAEASLLLQKIGYTEGDAKTLMEIWKADIEEKDLREAQKYVRDAYALSLITREQAENELRECGLSDEVIKVVMAKEDKRRLSSLKLPSVSTVVKWLKMRIINEEKAREILRRINVAEEYIDYYIAEGKAG